MAHTSIPEVIRRRSVLVALGGVGLAAIAGVSGVRAQSTPAPAPTAGGAIPATYTGGEGTAMASMAAGNTAAPPMQTTGAGSTAPANAVATTNAVTATVTSGGGGAAPASPGNMGPTPTYITGPGPLPKPLPTQGGPQPTIVGAAPPPPPAPPASPAPGTPAATATPAPAARVTITPGQTFDPPQVTVNRGETILWVNMARSPQTVTDNPVAAMDKRNAGLPMNGQPWSSGALNSGASFMRVFDVPGDYTYFSIPAEGQGLVGRITVRG